MNKKILFSILFIIFFTAVLFYLSYARFGLFFIDTSREAYIPMMMNKGALLYKDIFNIFTPLSYQINAFLFLIFGENLKTLYFAGLFNTLIFILGLFFISNLLLKKYLLFSLLFSLFILVSCIFAVSQGNYILPYAYAIVYSLSAIVWSIFCLLNYVKTKKDIFLILSFYLFGICISFKYDFIFLILVLIYFLKGQRTLLKIKCITALLSVPFLSFALLYFQGVSTSDLLSAFNYINKLLHSDISNLCYKLMGIIPTIETIKTAFISFLKTMPFILGILAISYKLNKIKKYGYIFLTIFAICIIYFFTPVFIESNAYYFNWVGIYFIIHCAIFILFLCRKQNIDIEDKMFLILNVCALLVSIKSITLLNFNSYGTFYFPLIALCVLSVLINYSTKNLITNAVYTLLIILIFCYGISNYQRRNYTFNSKIETNKGIIYAEEQMESAISDTLRYIEKNTEKDDKILVLPEGAMINFLTNRISDNKYFYLIPPNIEVFDEEKIVKDLEQNLPDYIILQPMSYNNFGQTYFCESFGGKICAILPKYYENPIVFGNEFWIALYKKSDYILH